MKTESPAAVAPQRWQFGLLALILLVAVFAVFAAVAAQLGVMVLCTFGVGFAVAQIGIALGRKLAGEVIWSVLAGLVASSACAWPVGWFVVFVVEGYPTQTMFYQDMGVVSFTVFAGGGTRIILLALREMTDDRAATGSISIHGGERSMMATVGDISKFLDGFAPGSLAESWDNVGLLIGDRGASITRVMTCLTVTPTTAQEAIERQAGMIVTHHPVLFRPVQKLTSDDVQGRTLWNLIRAGISVYSPHTAFDSTQGGINEMLAARLGITDGMPLRAAKASGRAKLVVFVPQGDLEKVSRAMFDAGAGVIGEYRECSFRVAGKGTFFGSETAQPAVGKPGRREEVDEWRLELLCPSGLIPTVVSAMRQVHSYEEPAYDIYPLDPEPANVGAGRYGNLAGQLTLVEFANRVRSALSSAQLQVIGSRDRLIRRVAVACGAGSEFLGDAKAAGCDVLVTGEASFHRQLEAEATEIALVAAGHFATERFALEELAGKISQGFANVEVWASQTERDPSWISR